MEDVKIRMQGIDETEPWRLQIDRVSNGYILTGKVDGSDTISVSVIEEKLFEDRLSELKAAQDLCHEILEYFGVFWSKHSEANLKISIVDQEEKEVDGLAV